MLRAKLATLAGAGAQVPPATPPCIISAAAEPNKSSHGAPTPPCPDAAAAAAAGAAAGAAAKTAPNSAALAAHPLRAAAWWGAEADLCDPGWMRALQAAGWHSDEPTVWVAEGLLVYLGQSDADALLLAVSGEGWARWTRAGRGWVCGMRACAGRRIGGSLDFNACVGGLYRRPTSLTPGHTTPPHLCCVEPGAPHSHLYLPQPTLSSPLEHSPPGSTLLAGVLTTDAVDAFASSPACRGAALVREFRSGVAPGAWELMGWSVRMEQDYVGIAQQAMRPGLQASLAAASQLGVAEEDLQRYFRFVQLVKGARGP